MNNLRETATLLLLALLPFQDTALQSTPLRTLGASLSVWPVLALFGLMLVRRLLELDLRVPRPLLWGAAYAASLCAVYLVLFGATYHNSSLIAKSLNLSILFGLYLFAMFGTTLEPDRFFRIGATLGFLFTILAVLLGPALDGNHLLHATLNADSRARGFCTESSTFSVQVVISGLLAAYATRSRLGKGAVLILTLVMLIMSGSKGGLISLLLCAAAFWLLRSGLNLKRLLLGATLLLPMIFLVSSIVQRNFEHDAFQEGTSVATRTSMAFFAWESVKHNPFGVGFSGYYPALHQYLPAAMQSARAIFDFPLVFTEVSEYQYTSENAGCKAFFLDLLVYFGLPFACVFLVFTFKLCRRLYRTQQHILFVGMLFTWIALVSYYSSVNTYSVPVLVGVSLSSARYDKHSLRKRA